MPKWHHDTQRNDNLLNDNRRNNTKHDTQLIDTGLLVAVMPSSAVFIVMRSVVIFKVRPFLLKVFMSLCKLCLC
jgi:hypothetical protein